MPRKDKEIRAAQNRDAKEKLDRACTNVPSHLKGRFSGKIKLLKGKGDKENDERFYNWNGFTRTADGELSLSYEHGKAANDIREKHADKTALRLFNHFGANFWERSYTKIIAEHAGVDPRTIRNYREKVRRQNGKAK